MIGAANLDYTTFCASFHKTLAHDCTSELEKLAEIKQKPFVAPNLDTSWVYKTYHWKYTFGNEPMTEKMYQILRFFHQKVNAVLNSRKEQDFKVNYTIKPADDTLEGIVYIPDGKYMPKKFGGGIDADMFDFVILPCLQKTLEKLNITMEFPVGKVVSLLTYSPKSFSDTDSEQMQTVETIVKMRLDDGFTKVNREDKKSRQKASFTGVSKSSVEQLKVVQVWYRQHETAVPEHIQAALKGLNVK